MLTAFNHSLVDHITIPRDTNAMHLVVFDIDGTLTNTYGVDTDCFVSAVTEVFEIPNVDDEWSNYRHVTDSGILSEILEANGIVATMDKIQKFESTFLRHLNLAYERTPQTFSEILGATNAVKMLSTRSDFRVALASGGFRETALFKLNKIGIDGTCYPSAFSNDSTIRSQIILCAIEKASSQERRPFDRITYVGDGVWDARACREVGIPFIGRASGPKTAQLRDEGAANVVPDFQGGTFFDLLQ